MTAQTEQSGGKGLDWPLIGFFALAYAAAAIIILSATPPGRHRAPAV